MHFLTALSAGMLVVTRLGVTITPKPILSVEFQRDSKELLVWRVEINSSKPASETALALKTKFPQYLGKVPLAQVHRLVKFALKLAPLAPPKTTVFDQNSPPDFVYDYRVDYGDMSRGTPHPFDEKDD